VSRPRAYVEYWVAGGVTTTLGAAVVVAGARHIAWAAELENPYAGVGADYLAQGAGMIACGSVIVTSGVHLWRAARRRGWRDRLGRLVTIVGQLLLGVVVARTAYLTIASWSAHTDADLTRMHTAVWLTLLVALPAGLLVWLGGRIAHGATIPRLRLRTS
jgi:hypothetical protein